MQVIWTEDALDELSSVLEYGACAFGKRAVERFYEKLLENELRLANNPYMGELDPLLAGRPQNFRSLVVHCHYKLVYYVEAETIYITALFDTRRDPAAGRE
ncbi:type II toxin-antitoxin system RelE/ParE family toxin [Parabacteroides bouchesdurhonensis]|uniref:type II toxin-antitoxin system RelE/ParE family toxin n=1 Tax=Parabacteroides bouchesdurhonensis TaxID=1936995 RepID=UPI000E50DA8D|nr:type II toxin-antitoxin system RelE/ParE family toxin [Parabacteroides bouchesdurhonensis]RHJ95358.1 type II toxin-antitoxin system RelE/ParE family toxin [Bacteroides sp. AM07-16]